MLARLRLIAVLVLAPSLFACLMPGRGTPVFVDSRAGDFWSGKGLLTEVSPDQKQCRVSVRDSALIVRDQWFSCERIHDR